MRVLQRDGKFEVLSPTDPPVGIELIETAGRTCYQSGQSREIDRESAARFAGMLIGRGHESVLEHLSHCTKMRYGSTLQGQLEYLNELCELQQETVGLRRTRYNADGAFRFDLISANVRTIRDAARRCPHNSVAAALHFAFAARWPELFDDLDDPAMIIGSNPAASPFEDESLAELALHHQLEHRYATVRFTDHSRGFTHELVRHRLAGYSQESTRYVDERESAWVAAPAADLISPVVVEFAGETLHMSRIDMAEMEYAFYKACREAGDPPQDARQFLPIGTTSEIVMSCNLREWRQVFRMRCHKAAHWEIRETMVGLCLEFQNFFPGCFSDFTVAGTCRDGIEYMEVPDAT